jgi:hypothetical protein
MKIGSASSKPPFRDRCRSVGMVHRVSGRRCERRGTLTFHGVVAPLARTHPGLSRGLRSMVRASRLRPRSQDRHRFLDCPCPRRSRCHPAIARPSPSPTGAVHRGAENAVAHTRARDTGHGRCRGTGRGHVAIFGAHLSIDDDELQKVKISGIYSSTDPASLINFLRSQPSIQVIETENQVRVVRRGTH